MARSIATGDRRAGAAAHAPARAARGRRPGERGYAMAALLVALSVMAVALGVALPAWNTMMRREREAELIFRGEQWARAVALFQRRYGNALPPSVDVLVNERFIRKRYRDPITGEEFQLVGPGTPLPGLPGADDPQGGRGGRGGRGATTPPPPFTLGGQGTGRGDVPAGGILGVVSRSTDQSLRLYNGRERYNEWVFLATEMSRTPGGGGATLEIGPGGRGAPVPGGRGIAQPPGRGTPPGGRPTGPGGRGPFPPLPPPARR